MFLDWVKYLPVFFGSMIKFILGPTWGVAAGLSVTETALLTTAGMMASVLIFTFVGSAFRVWFLKRFPKRNKKFSKLNRRFVTVWKRYGVQGVSFLTPLILTPILGTLLVSSVGAHRKQVFSYMLISALFWSFLFSFLFKFIFPDGIDLAALF